MKYSPMLAAVLAFVLAGPAAAQTTTPSTSTPIATPPGTGPQQDRQQLCDGQPCETPDQQRDMQKLHSQDMDWLNNYGPAAGGTPGTAQQRGPHGANQGQGQGPSGAGAGGGGGPGPH